jgi:ferredoxin
MAYVIGSKCTGMDTACLDACPVDCIYRKSNGARPRLYISDAECLDCGACALACPESAIASVAGLARYERPRPAADAPLRAHVKLPPGARKADKDMTVEIPADKTVLNGRVESWAYLMSAMAD